MHCGRWVFVGICMFLYFVCKSVICMLYECIAMCLCMYAIHIAVCM